MSHKILVAQGGGPTAVINQSLVGVALEAQRYPEHLARLRGAARGARHRQRRPRRSRPGDGGQSRGGRRDARGCARLHPGQAGPQILPGDFQGPQGARDRHVLLHWRQRFLRHGADRLGGGEEGRPFAAGDPHPEDDRQRPRRLRPRAGIPFGGALRRAGLRRRQSRQHRAERRLLRRGDGSPCGLPDGGLRAARANIPTTARTSSICPNAPSSSTSSSPT